ncbi:MAG: hypothetical protein LBV12_02425 [Puniceicoccales bacterium]|jgi:hypothetical protein|nr:hypothetical protein [Puniceicoccales bacterium]
MTLIEKALFLDHSAHYIRALEINENTLSLTVYPCMRTDVCSHARFDNVRALHIQDMEPDEPHELPWDIIGFDSKQLTNGYWKFVLYTGDLEYSFESLWPVITKAE